VPPVLYFGSCLLLSILNGHARSAPNQEGLFIVTPFGFLSWTFAVPASFWVGKPSKQLKGFSPLSLVESKMEKMRV
jgi:hypothetical protein